MKIKESSYVAPTAKIVEIKAQAIICASQMTSSQTEGYEEGSTEGWFDN